ncbi:MAG TPA: hypothetical protein VK891_18735 [Euzebyales bacterium]|nr:hypothetical protein [Euzebyales bacterium]
MRDEQLYAFVADARARGAADLRRRTRWLHQQLRQDAAFVELCRDLGASGVTVEVSLCDGRQHRGRLAGAGADALAVATADDTTAYIATSAIIGLRVVAPPPEQHGRPAESAALRRDEDRSEGGDPLTGAAVMIRDDQRFSDVLGDIADLRARVVVGTAAQQTFCGVLAGVGRDVVWFDDNQWYLRLPTITDVMIVP